MSERYEPTAGAAAGADAGAGPATQHGPVSDQVPTAGLPRATPAPPPGPFDGHSGPGVPDAPHVTAPSSDRRGRSQRRGAGALVASVAGLSLLLGLGGGIAGATLVDRLGQGGGVSSPSGSPPGSGPITGSDASDGDEPPVRDPDSVAGVAARVLPSVVSVEVRTPQGAGTGSGFVIDESGLLLTNNHVISAAAGEGDALQGEIAVVFVDGSRAEAELVGRTVRYDLAVLRVDRDGLTPLEFSEDEVVVGDPVVAVGAPLGLQSTVTSGIVSALDRPVTAGQGQGEASFMNAVQTDAAINPGNSGGPLVDLSGRVVGINSAIAQAPGAGGGGGGGNIGLGFAIPAEQAVRTSQEIIDTGEATYPVIGVVPDPAYTGRGVRIATEADRPTVTPGSVAERAGIEPGDVILEFNGRPLTEDVELVVAVSSQRPGDTVTLSVERDGETREVQLVLEDTAVD